MKNNKRLLFLDQPGMGCKGGANENRNLEREDTKFLGLIDIRV